MNATVPLTEGATVRHVIDPAQSKFVVQVFATGLLSAFGHSPKIAILDFGGEVNFASGGTPLAGAHLTLRIQADSLQSIDGNEKDREEIDRRMRQEVLETRDFPDILYECTRVIASGSGNRYWASLKGDLTLHGITHSVPVSAIVTINGASLRASGEFKVRQSEFGIAAVSAAAGTIRVKDEVTCTFDIVATRQE